MHEYLIKIQSLIELTPQDLNPSWYILILIVGLIIGSFLNVVIYRSIANYLPEETKYKGRLDTCHPKHSFCPQCLHPLSWKENIPLLSWIFQGGKCAHCKANISIQYPLVEGLNALLWVLLWGSCPSIAQFLVYSIFSSILIAVTVIDIKTLKIPNKITLTGIALIIGLTVLVSTSTTLTRLLAVLGAAILGYCLVELGKFLFGRKKVRLKEYTEFELNQKDGTLRICEEGKSLLESEAITTEELFTRPSDTIQISGDIEPITDKKPGERYSLVIYKDKCQIVITNKNYPKQPPHNEQIPKDLTVRGKIKEITIPQEAFGMGDVKLLMLIAAAMGYPNFVYSMVLGSLCGLVYALILRLKALAKKENAPAGAIAFGPWLATASIILVFFTLWK